jgi:hypothetical protein
VLVCIGNHRQAGTVVVEAPSTCCQITISDIGGDNFPIPLWPLCHEGPHAFHASPSKPLYSRHRGRCASSPGPPLLAPTVFPFVPGCALCTHHYAHPAQLHSFRISARPASLAHLAAPLPVHPPTESPRSGSSL